MKAQSIAVLAVYFLLMLSWLPRSIVAQSLYDIPDSVLDEDLASDGLLDSADQDPGAQEENGVFAIVHEVIGWTPVSSPLYRGHSRVHIDYDFDLGIYRDDSGAQLMAPAPEYNANDNPYALSLPQDWIERTGGQQGIEIVRHSAYFLYQLAQRCGLTSPLGVSAHVLSTTVLQDQFHLDKFVASFIRQHPIGLSHDSQRFLAHLFLRILLVTRNDLQNEDTTEVEAQAEEQRMLSLLFPTNSSPDSTLLPDASAIRLPTSILDGDDSNEQPAVQTIEVCRGDGCRGDSSRSAESAIDAAEAARVKTSGPQSSDDQLLRQRKDEL